MTFTLHHPDDWIGIPDRWPFPGENGTEFADAEHWITALVDVLGQEEDAPAPPIRERVREVLTMAAQRSARSATRVFVLFEGWDGPAFIVEALTQSDEVLGTRSLEEFVGADDPAQLGAPYLEDVETRDGLSGVLCIRYLPFDAHGVVYGRIDYAFQAEGQVLTVSGGELDLVDFERLKVHASALAATVALVPA